MYAYGWSLVADSLLPVALLVAVSYVLHYRGVQIVKLCCGNCGRSCSGRGASTCQYCGSDRASPGAVRAGVALPVVICAAVLWTLFCLQLWGTVYYFVLPVRWSNAARFSEPRSRAYSEVLLRAELFSSPLDNVQRIPWQQVRVEITTLQGIRRVSFVDLGQFDPTRSPGFAYGILVPMFREAGVQMQRAGVRPEVLCVSSAIERCTRSPRCGISGGPDDLKVFGSVEADPADFSRDTTGIRPALLRVICAWLVGFLLGYVRWRFESRKLLRSELGRKKGDAPALSKGRTQDE